MGHRRDDPASQDHCRSVVQRAIQQLQRPLDAPVGRCDTAQGHDVPAVRTQGLDNGLIRRSQSVQVQDLKAVAQCLGDRHDDPQTVRDMHGQTLFSHDWVDEEDVEHSWSYLGNHASPRKSLSGSVVIPFPNRIPPDVQLYTGHGIKSSNSKRAVRRQ